MYNQNNRGGYNNQPNNNNYKGNNNIPESVNNNPKSTSWLSLEVVKSNKKAIAAGGGIIALVVLGKLGYNFAKKKWSKKDKIAEQIDAVAEETAPANEPEQK